MYLIGFILRLSTTKSVAFSDLKQDQSEIILDARH